MEPAWEIFDSRQLTLWLSAMLGLLSVGVVTWMWFARVRQAGHEAFNHATVDGASVWKGEVFDHGLRLALSGLLFGAFFLIGAILLLLRLRSDEFLSPNFYNLGPIVWTLLGAGTGVLASSAATVVDLCWAQMRYRLLRKVRNDYLGGLPESKLKDVDIARQAKRERAEILLERNLEAHFVIKQLVFANTGIFRQLSWNPSPNINIMLGRNGYGKSYLLRLMVGLLSYDNDRLTELVGEMGSGFNMRVGLLRDGRPVEIEHDGKTFDESIGKVPVLAIPDSRFLNRARPSVGSDGGDYADVARHGSHHFLYDQPFESTIETVLAEMCIDVLDREGRNERYPQSPQLRLIEQVLFGLSGECFQFESISPIGSARFAIKVETEASPKKPIALQKASQGTLSIIAIFALIYQYLRRLYPKHAETTLCNQPALVLIDEIDAHLHPAWQRKIVHLLRERFPNVQFLLTAHSPLVVAGCSYGEVSVLKRCSQTFKIEEFQRDFVGSSVEDIYREIFDIGERDETFLKYYAQLPLMQDLERELQTLRAKGGDEARIRRVESELSLIKRTTEQEDKDLEFEVLQRENEQLKRQLVAAQGSRQEAAQ